jgi:hypothetical protein
MWVGISRPGAEHRVQVRAVAAARTCDHQRGDGVQRRLPGPVELAVQPGDRHVQCRGEIGAHDQALFLPALPDVLAHDRLEAGADAVDGAVQCGPQLPLADQHLQLGRRFGEVGGVRQLDVRLRRRGRQFGRQLTTIPAPGLVPFLEHVACDADEPGVQHVRLVSPVDSLQRAGEASLTQSSRSAGFGSREWKYGRRRA